MKSKITAASYLATVLIALGFPGVSAAQNGVRSLPVTDSEPEDHAESSAVIGLEKLVQENRRLRAENTDLGKALAAATAEAEIFRRQVKELTLRMEALGPNVASPNGLQQRLLQAVNTMRFSENARQELTKSLARLAQISTEFAKRPDAEAKMVLESELKRVDEVLAKAVGGEMLDQAAQNNVSGPDLLNGKVSAFKSEFSCAVINLGSKQGVKVGMPFQVRRGAKIIAYVRVVDVRQTFAGTVIQNLVSEKDPVQVGDSVRVDAQLN
jgi:hypothetical protein